MREKNVLNPASFSGFVQRGVHVFTRTKRVQHSNERVIYFFQKQANSKGGLHLYKTHGKP